MSEVMKKSFRCICEGCFTSAYSNCFQIALPTSVLSTEVPTYLFVHLCINICIVKTWKSLGIFLKTPLKSLSTTHLFQEIQKWLWNSLPPSLFLNPFSTYCYYICWVFSELLYLNWLIVLPRVAKRPRERCLAL